jgi:hypothetical protein
MSRQSQIIAVSNWLPEQGNLCVVAEWRVLIGHY